MAAAPASVKQAVLDLLASSARGVTDEMLTEKFGLERMQSLVLPVLNTMMQANRLNSRAAEGGGVLFTLVDEQVASKLQGLSPEMMMVYHEIERAGSNGISSGEIKKKTNIQQNTVTKATKELDRRSLIKRVKSIHQKTQKIWMLYDLMPSTAITGGPWYTDNEFDHEFVTEICKIAESQVKEEWEVNGRPTSLQEVDRRIAGSGVSQEALSNAHIRQILNRLVFDGKVEELAAPPMLPHSSDRPPDAGPWFKSCALAVTHYDRFTSLPCGVCPVFDQCAPGGVVSPESCVYLNQWWEEPDLHPADPDSTADANAAAAARSSMAVEDMF
mmetsp:Transcript_64725/g.146019  ORF Transcript_64725/g.146019 Transcript_64725/m.146019 type:complete len:329 (-) Transcript_64725:27-1013(-)